jgi:hypothetical protein
MTSEVIDTVRPALTPLRAGRGRCSRHVTNPLADVTGQAGVAAVISGAREMFPGLVFRSAGVLDGHHDIVRFGWQLGPEGVDPA